MKQDKFLLGMLALSSGFLFSLGLCYSQMINPSKVIGFLDVFGSWDISLLYVMIGAVITTGVIYLFLKNRKKTLLGYSFESPSNKKITLRLIIGSCLFGLGWGFAGYCPGPSIVSTFMGNGAALLFLLSMLISQWITKNIHRNFFQR